MLDYAEVLMHAPPYLLKNSSAQKLHFKCFFLDNVQSKLTIFKISIHTEDTNTYSSVDRSESPVSPTNASHHLHELSLQMANLLWHRLAFHLAFIKENLFCTM